MLNASKLHKELVAASLDITGVDSDGNISWAEEPTDEMLTKAKEVIATHDPIDYEELKNKEYPAISVEGILKTLKHIQAQGTNIGEDAESWVAKVEAVQNKYQKE